MKITIHEMRNEDRRGRDRYGHSVRRLTAKDLSSDPEVEVTKIFAPTMDDMEKCKVSANGSLRVLFTVDGEHYQLTYNPHLEGYEGMRAMAHESCTITNLDTNKTWTCTGLYSIPWITYRGHMDWISDHKNDPEVKAYMNPTEKMVLDNFINPFVKDYLS